MTVSEFKNGNGWKSTLLTIAGALIMILLSINAYFLRADAQGLKDTNKSQTTKIDSNKESIATLSARQDVQENNYEHIREMFLEIKQDIKDLKEN